ncbi:glycosyl hydrolase family 28-related protein [Klebsiella oxytoca]|uniref:Phage tail protein n=3 Tax=Klebsiella oxytoca TaxID=571 RepID=A0AAI9DUG2_KLEOX|nr:glycosyl hydrolase family 28-related protein [Klebsiella oxytoca]AKL09085.1 phage tail fiber protein [Klebsiella oxytoca]AKL26027.1 phage tail fiber protein [Klebsiella oxytoca]APB44478.1 phage tail protein [Klebsiella oxytoca]EJB5613203.1 phage tail protein [Klebsiella oxytoca]EJZ8382415.1 phage tail protein [Klebsiella oxytoca]
MKSYRRRDFIDLAAKLGISSIFIGTSSRFAFASGITILNVADFGAKGDGVTDDSFAFQKAFLKANEFGGAKVYFPKPRKEYLLKFPVFLFNNTEAYGDGQQTRIVFENPVFSKGRGGFVIGSSLEANRELALTRFNSKSLSTTINKNFKNPIQRHYIRDSPELAQAKGSSLHDIYIEARYTTDSESNWGGYGINFVNAIDCHAKNIWGKGWTQLIGMGSDTPPETPSNHNCSATNLYILQPDLVRTYYSVGFMANSSNCTIQNAKQWEPMTAGSKNGSGVALNFCEDCIVSDIDIPDLGRTQTSEGILINNSSGCLIQNITIGNAKKAVSTFFNFKDTQKEFKPNLIKNVKGSNCDIVLSIYSKFNIIRNIKGEKSRRIIALMNSNAAHNIISAPEADISTPGKSPINMLMKLNTIE